jgi:uncharacterized protein (DUF362 family)
VDRRPPPLPSAPDVVIVRRGQADELVRAAVGAIGGVERFVERGDRVLVKPNIGWDRVPLTAANTSPAVVAALVRLCRDAGARQVMVGDVSCNDARRSFDRSGIGRAAREAGADVVLPSGSRPFRVADLGGAVLRRWPVFEPALECDKLINVPVVKNHTLAGLTCALKNWYGVLGGRRERLHQSIDESIADLATFFLPTLTVVDAVRVMFRGGPTGGSPSDTRRLDTLVASVDQVAADAVASGLIDLAPSDVPYLAMASQRGAGRSTIAALRVSEVDLA